MAYVIIENNEVIFKSNKSYPGSIEVEESVGTGMIQDADGNFSYPPIPEEIVMRTLRQERNGLLSASDWTQSRDVELTNDADWKTYRQALRDVPANVSKPVEEDLSNVTWPTEPE